MRFFHFICVHFRGKASTHGGSAICSDPQIHWESQCEALGPLPVCPLSPGMSLGNQCGSGNRL